MESDTQKIRIKIGEAEFEAEGPSELVQSQFTAFLDAVSKAPAEKSPSAGASSDPNSGLKPPANPGDPPPSISSEEMNCVFHDNGEFVSLSATPVGDGRQADSLLILLYGFAKLKNEPKVTGVMLMKAMRQSGVTIDRVDRVIESKQEYILMGGSKRGKRYSLNNRGYQYVEGLIRDLL